MAGGSLVAWARETAAELLTPLGRRRWGHTQGVASAATDLTVGLTPGDRSVLVAAAWVHDVGYAPALTRTGFHPLDGARYLAGQGFPDSVVELVAYHSGAEYEADERGLLSELASLPRPRPDLLDRLTAADMSTSPDGAPVQPVQRLAEILTRYEPAHPVHRAVSRSRPELLEATRRAHQAATVAD